ncbi:MAG: hypothetical protein RIC80_04810 [Cyclobacteriaceae bacterium]
MSKLVVTLGLVLLALMADAQEWQLMKKVKLATTCELSSKDRNNYLYIADLRGNIYQYDKDGNQANLYSTRQLGQIYLLESWQGLRTFAFYQDLQEYLITDRFLSNERTYLLKPSNYIRLATLSQDLNLWILGEDNLLLQKINAIDQSVILENQWSNEFFGDDLNITYIKEYKNRVYLLDESQRIIIFDNLGNFITTIDAKGVKKISFTDQYIYANRGGEVIKIDLNSLQREIIKLPVSTDQIHVIHGVYYLINKDELSMYAYKPL